MGYTEYGIDVLVYSNKLTTECKEHCKVQSQDLLIDGCVLLVLCDVIYMKFKIRCHI